MHENPTHPQDAVSRSPALAEGKTHKPPHPPHKAPQPPKEQPDEATPDTTPPTAGTIEQ